ncbi:MAG TPA: hypothetical protein VFC78_01500, partial [Tepidisphaeraceae bacterium]|nr:hypothetical protein [Tepidisphaeraceae bacterium]
VAANTPSVIQQACGHEFVSFLKIGNSRGDGHVHFFSSTTYAKAGRTVFFISVLASGRYLYFCLEFVPLHSPAEVALDCPFVHCAHSPGRLLGDVVG